MMNFLRRLFRRPRIVSPNIAGRGYFARHEMYLRITAAKNPAHRSHLNDILAFLIDRVSDNSNLRSEIIKMARTHRQELDALLTLIDKQKTDLAIAQTDLATALVYAKTPDEIDTLAKLTAEADARVPEVGA